MTAYVTVTDPDAVREVFRRVDDFAPTNALVAVTPLSAEALRILSRVRFALPPVLASATGEQHRRTRTLVARFFTPAKVAAIGPEVVRLTRERVRQVEDRLHHGPVDLVHDISRHIPPAIMATLIGGATPELTQLNRWSQDSLELFWGWPEPDRQRELAESAAEFYEWLRAEVRSCRGTDTLFGTLDAAGLSVAEICSLGYFLVIAGQETTAQLINILLFRALETPSTWTAAATDAQRTVRNVLASMSSVPTWRRTATADVTLHGRRIPAGAEILLELTGHHPADADPNAYSLAFGYGVHRCLGAKLAELEARVVLEATARALPGIRLVDAHPPWRRLLSFQTPTRVLVARGES